VTWTFLYAAALVFGLALAAVTGLIRDLRCLAHNVVVPHADQRSAFLGPLGPRLAVALVFGGAVGLFAGARRAADPRTPLLLALAAGLAGFLLAVMLLRSRRSASLRVERATVVRDILPGGYGQIRFERAGGSVVLAAQSVDQAVIPAGCEVEVLDCTRSVVTVRRPTAA